MEPLVHKAGNSLFLSSLSSPVMVIFIGYLMSSCFLWLLQDTCGWVWKQACRAPPRTWGTGSMCCTMTFFISYPGPTRRKGWRCWLGRNWGTDWYEFIPGRRVGSMQEQRLQAPDTFFIVPLDKFQDTNAKVKLLIISRWQMEENKPQVGATFWVCGLVWMHWSPTQEASPSRCNRWRVWDSG